MKIMPLLRILVFTGCALLLVQTRIHTTRAQTVIHSCVKSWNTTSSQPCNMLCCTNPGAETTDEIVTTDDNSAGNQSEILTSLNCGPVVSSDAETCLSNSCRAYPFYQGFPDSACCSGLLCDQTTDACASRLSNGNLCLSNSQCCSGNCVDSTCQQSGGGGGGGGGSVSDSCSSDGDCEGNIVGSACGVCSYGGDDCFDDPIIIDLTGAGFLMTSVNNGVRFDFRGSGTPVQMAWTQAGADVGFLVLDRNGNGRIDDGAELFSELSPQPQGPGGKNGFKALAVFDEPANGGDGDSNITMADAIWPKLRIWADANHNGISEPSELLSLNQAGIQGILLRYHPAHFTDQYGIEFRYRSYLLFYKPVKKRAEVYDVLLPQQ
jgi:hypothetical protein